MSPQTGFDCSGLVSYLLDEAGFDRHGCRHANEYEAPFPALPRDDPMAGDLVLFSRNNKWPTHVGVMVSPDAYVHAPGTGKPLPDGSPETVCVAPLAPRRLLPEGSAYRFDPMGFRRIYRRVGTWNIM